MLNRWLLSLGRPSTVSLLPGHSPKARCVCVEVRSALSLARLSSTEGKNLEARKLLEAMCSRCADGWTSPEMEQAKNFIADSYSSSTP